LNCAVFKALLTPLRAAGVCN